MLREINCRLFELLFSKDKGIDQEEAIQPFMSVTPTTKITIDLLPQNYFPELNLFSLILLLFEHLIFSYWIDCNSIAYWEKNFRVLLRSIWGNFFSSLFCMANQLFRNRMTTSRYLNQGETSTLYSAHQALLEFSIDVQGLNKVLDCNKLIILIVEITGKLITY